MNTLRLTPTGIDKRAFEIRRYRIHHLRLMPTMVVFIVLALILALLFGHGHGHDPQR